MRSRTLRHGALLGTLLIGAAAESRPLTALQCAELLSRDRLGPSLHEAAVRNLSATELRGPAAAARRAASDAIVAAAGAPDPRDPEQLCARLVVERMETAALLTGYYRPVVPARRVRDERFRYPLYGLPEPGLRAFSRAEIDGGALEGRTEAVAWLDDPVEAFFIHVQGSAVLDTPEGRLAVGYAGSNERPYTSIGARLIRDGRMQPGQVSMDVLKTYLRDHPSERDGILHANERYIFFRVVEDHAIGSLGVPLSDGRSVAADPSVYAPGTLLFIAPRSAAATVSPRLVFVQDRGSAITGASRLDLYVGTGAEAARIAGPLQEPVDVYVLGPR